MSTGRMSEKETRLDGDRIKRIGGAIEFKKAKEWIRNYRQKNPDEVVSHLFGRDVIEKMLGQKDCKGIRIYYGDSKRLNTWQRLILLLSNVLRNSVAGAIGEKQLILVGVDSYLYDQLPEGRYKPKTINEGTQEKTAFTAEISVEGQDDYSLNDQSWPCPGTPSCPNNEWSN